MSSKGDKDSAKHTSGSRVLRKARSFKDDLKSRIVRRTPSVTRSESPSGPQKSPTKSPKRRVTKQAVSVTASDASDGDYSHSDRVENIKAVSDDIQKLESHVKTVEQTLSYLRDAVKKCIPQLVPGTSTVVLETVLEVHRTISNYLPNEQSSLLTSSYNALHQSLARLMQWSNGLNLQEEPVTLPQEDSLAIINAVHTALMDLVKLALEKLKQRGDDNLQGYQTLPPRTPKTPPASLPSEECPSRTSLIDVPLSPREKEILHETQQLGDGAVSPVKADQGSIESSNVNSTVIHRPPPKPPLPPSWPRTSKTAVQTKTASVQPPQLQTIAPPPLPVKKRLTSGNYDNTCCVEQPQQVSPHLIHHHQTHHQHVQVQQQQTWSNSIGVRQLALPDQSPNSVSPQSQSPTGSCSSAYSHSSEDLLDGHSDHQINHNQRLSHYDNLDNVDKSHSEGDSINVATKCHNHIADMTRRFQQLTENCRSWDSQEDYDNFHNPIAGSLVVAKTSGQKAPPLPQKIGSQRICSQYDNVSGMHYQHNSSQQSDLMIKSSILRGMRMSRSAQLGFSSAAAAAQISSIRSTATSKSHFSISQETFSRSETFSSTGTESSAENIGAPPLPLKKKNVAQYAHTFGQTASPVLPEFCRHSIHSVNFYQDKWFQHQRDMLFPPTVHQNRAKVISTVSDTSSLSSSVSHNSDVLSIVSGSSSDEYQTALPTPPLVPPKTLLKDCTCTFPNVTSDIQLEPSLPQILPAVLNTSDKNSESEKSQTVITKDPTKHTPSIQGNGNTDMQLDVQTKPDQSNTLDDVDVTEQLIRQKTDDGMDIRGGWVDALIVHATTGGKKNFLYQEAFLTTYRTFISAKDLVEKLIYRYHRFSPMTDVKKSRLARNAFSLLVRVVDDLCTEIDEELLKSLMQLEYLLLGNGELTLARIIRMQLLEKVELMKQLRKAAHNVTLLSSHQLTTRQHHLMEFKSELLALQMTLLDAEYFQKIEIAEVLLWAKEQNEEHSPHLTTFTEHFNKMSYWCRTQILRQDEPKEKERHLMKFIKIMRHLRKLSNFNSYLAILSALDSSPIRRLDLHKQHSEELQEFSELIDSSSSFRAYRQALSQTEPPCIPYIGLILQDLTFVHIGNPDNLRDGSINFSKRWQQFQILDNMRRFKACKFEIRRSNSILEFFDDFNDGLSEESLWQISEAIKPRGGHKKQSGASSK